MPIYPGRTPGTHRVVVCLNNKNHERIVDGSKAEAISFEARFRVELETGFAKQTRNAPTFSEFCGDQYRAHAESHLSESTWKVRQYQLATLNEFFGRTRLLDFRTEFVEQYKHFRKPHAKPISINNELKVLQAVVTEAKRQGKPVGHFEVKLLPVRGRGRVTFWTLDQLFAIFVTCQKVQPNMLPILTFLANTGCRKGEAIACEWSWVDLYARFIRIPVNEYWRPKSNEPREIPIADGLLPWLERPREHERWVFPSRDGGRFSQFPKRRFDEIREAAGVRGGPHTFRHTYAAHFLAAVPDMFLLAQVMGHSHQRVTELYGHLLPDHLKRARNAVSLASIALLGAAKE